jgi:hypothetical protein
MIYDPITRQQVEIIGQYPPQKQRFRFGRKEKARKGEQFTFVKVRYGDWIADWARERGGFPIGEERDAEPHFLVADEGSREISEAVEAAPMLTADKIVS